MPFKKTTPLERVYAEELERTRADSHVRAYKVREAWDSHKKGGTKYETGTRVKDAKRLVERTIAHRVAGDIDELGAFDELRESVNKAERFAVRQLRQEGWSWADIAKRLGVSKQAAQQRFGED